MPHCRDCNIVLELGDNWSPSLAAIGSRHCRACATAYARRHYRKVNPNSKPRIHRTAEQREEARKATIRRYYEKNQEAILAQNRARYHARRELLSDPTVQAAIAEALTKLTPPTLPGA